MSGGRAARAPRVCAPIAALAALAVLGSVSAGAQRAAPDSLRGAPRATRAALPPAGADCSSAACRRTAAAAEHPPPGADLQAVRALYVDMSIPESPAFVALGASPSTITRPSTPNELAIAILSGMNPAGRIQSGIAVDAVPYLLARGGSLTIRAYRDSASWLRRALYGAQLSLASLVSGAGDSTGTAAAELALGVRLVPYDRGDPRLDRLLAADLARLLEPDRAPDRPPEVPMAVTRLGNLADSVRAARARSRARNWNESRIEVGAALVLRSPDGTAEHLRGNGGAAWVSLAQRWGTRAQVVEHVRYKHTPHAAATDSALAGLRLRVGGPTFAWDIEGALYHSHGADPGSASWARAVTGFEVRLANGTWLEVGFGSDIGGGIPPGRFLSLANVKWSLSDDRLLAGAP